jgi:hypothetical protein
LKLFTRRGKEAPSEPANETTAITT